jgi:hypothetical protein
MFKGRTLHYSYATCGEKSGDEDKDSHQNIAAVESMCKSNSSEADWGKAGCRCRGLSRVSGYVTAENFSYDAAVGSNCSAWDLHANPACSGSHPPDWCFAKWCHVDPCECDVAALGEPPQPSSIAQGSFPSTGSPVYYSYATCGSSDVRSLKVDLPNGMCKKTSRREEVIVDDMAM